MPAPGRASILGLPSLITIFRYCEDSHSDRADSRSKRRVGARLFGRLFTSSAFWHCEPQRHHSPACPGYLRSPGPSGNLLICRIEFVILTVTPIAGRGGEGDRREPRPGQSGCHRGPGSHILVKPQGSIAGPRTMGTAAAASGRARRGHPVPGSRSSPSARAGRRCARRLEQARAEEEHHSGIVRRAELPVDG